MSKIQSSHAANKFPSYHADIPPHIRKKKIHNANQASIKCCIYLLKELRCELIQDSKNYMGEHLTMKMQQDNMDDIAPILPQKKSKKAYSMTCDFITLNFGQPSVWPFGPTST